MSDGEYVVGSNWGQDVNETLLTQMIGAYPTPDDMVGQMERHLLRMPVEALRVFEPFIPGARAADFSSQQSAVEAIMGTILDGPLTQGVIDTVNKLLEQIKEIIDNIVDGWLGIDIGTGGWNPFNVHSTTAEIAAAIQGMQVQINEFISNSNTGVSATENFQTYPNGGVGSKWGTWHTGLAAETIEIKDGRMWLFCFPLATRHGWARYRAKPTDTDYQRVGAVFGSKPMSGLFGATAYNYILGRMSTFETDGSSVHVFAKFGVNKVFLGCRIRGTETIWASKNFTFNPSASYMLQCGVRGQNGQPDAPYTFRLFENTTQILEGIDTNKVSSLGSLHRHAGLGFSNDNALQSATVASFVMFDSK